MTGKLANRCRRSLLATLAVGIVVVGGCLGATSASAAAVTGTGLTGTTAATPTGIASVAQQQENVIAPAYYVTPSGKRLSADEVAAGSESAAASESLPVFFIAPGQEGDLDGIHACRQTGSSGGVTGVECADLFAMGLSSTRVDVYAAGEGYCQTPDGYVQCPAIKFIAEVAQAPLPGVADIVGPGTIDCGGHSTPKCDPSGRNYFTFLDQAWQVSGCDINPGAGYEFWTIVLPSTIIALPGSVNTSAGGNLASQHAIVCSDD